MKETIDQMPMMSNPKSLPYNELRQLMASESLLKRISELGDKIEMLFGVLGVDLDDVKTSSESLKDPINKVGASIDNLGKISSSDAKELKKLMNIIAELIRNIKFPEVKIPEMPSEMKVMLDPADKAELKPIAPKDFPSSMQISNLNSLELILRDIEMKIASIVIPGETRVSNLSEIVIPQQKDLQLDPMVLQYLSRLDLLTNDPKKGLSVQLTDGEEFYKGMGGAIATAMGGGSKDPTTPYKIADVDDDATTKYYGFTRADGKWMIMKEVTSTDPKTYRYCAGAEDYTTNFTNRASLTYGYFHEVNI